jgi:hypothetical protein
MDYYRTFTVGKIPKLSRISKAEDLAEIDFADGVAEVEVPIELIDIIPLKHYERLNSPRLLSVINAIRREGYSSLEPIVCRVGRRGNWIVIDGGHRVTAAKKVSQEFFTNLFGQKVGDLTFVLFHTPMSYSKLKRKMDRSEAGFEGVSVARKRKKKKDKKTQKTGR